MKKKIMVLTLISSLLFGGVAGAAASQYYFGLIEQHKNEKKQMINDRFQEQTDHNQQVIYRNTIGDINIEMERLDKEIDQYYDDRMSKEVADTSKQNKEEVHAATDKAIADLKIYIDSLIDNKEQ